MRQLRSISRGKSSSVGLGLTVPLLSMAVFATIPVAMRSASAETEVRGLPNAVYVRAENAPLGEVLAAISAEFKLKYPARFGLDRTVTGIYSGTLRQVLLRILEGSNFVIKYSGDDTEIRVLSSASVADRADTSLAVAVNQNATASSRKAELSGPMPAQIPPLVPK